MDHHWTLRPLRLASGRQEPEQARRRGKLIGYALAVGFLVAIWAVRGPTRRPSGWSSRSSTAAIVAYSRSRSDSRTSTRSPFRLGTQRPERFVVTMDAEVDA